MRSRKIVAALAIVTGLALIPIGSGPASAHNKGRHCTRGYRECLHPASDYDCRGGSGNGPRYTGLVHLTRGSSDPYGLDSDNDGLGCE